MLGDRGDRGDRARGKQIGDQRMIDQLGETLEAVCLLADLLAGLARLLVAFLALALSVTARRRAAFFFFFLFVASCSSRPWPWSFSLLMPLKRSR